MDRLYQRYAYPFSFIQDMISVGRFCEFVDNLWTTTEKEQNDRELWEFYLHRIYDKSFDAFKEELRIHAMNRNLSAQNLEATIKNSMSILNKLKPEKGGEA